MKALQALEAIGKCRIVMGEGDEALVSQNFFAIALCAAVRVQCEFVPQRQSDHFNAMSD